MAIDLPDDCWEYIFSFLHPFFSQRLPVTLVCKRFLAITNKSRNDLTFAYNQEVPSTVPPVLYARFPNLTSIHVTTPDPNIDGFIRQLAASGLRLQALHLSSQPHFPRQAMRLLGNNMRDTLRFLTCNDISSMTEDDIIVIADCFSYLHRLKLLGPSVKQEASFITDEAIRAISIKLVSLVSITIRPGVGDKFSHLSFEYLALNCPSLLELDGIFFKDRTGELDWFVRFTSLTSLRFAYANISDTGLVHLSRSGNLKNLSTLGLLCPGEGIVNGSTMCRFLKSCSSLKYLDLFAFHFSSYTIDMDFVGSISKSIKVLRLYNCVNLPKNMLYNLLKSCPELEEVNLTNSEAVAIPEKFDLPLHHSLRKLAIGSTTLSEKAMMLFCSVCPRLEQLDIICSSQITTRGVKEIFIAGYGRFDCLSVSKSFDGSPKKFKLYKWYKKYDDYYSRQLWYMVKDDDEEDDDEEEDEDETDDEDNDEEDVDNETGEQDDGECDDEEGIDVEKIITKYERYLHAQIIMGKWERRQ